MNNRRVHMPHALAKALFEASIQHFDVGGMVAPPMAPQGGVDANGAQTTLGGLLGTLSGQSNYSAKLAPTQLTNYGGLISSSAGNALNGYGTSQDILGQQQTLANLLLSQSQGNGPSVADALLNNATGSNAAATGAAMAGARGSSGNVGLMARQIGQQGAATQQQGVGQLAAQRAGEQLGAETALGGTLGTMASGNTTEQGVNAGLFGASSGAQNSQNNTNVSNYNDMQTINSGISQTNAKQGGSFLGGALNAVGGFLGLAKGGKIPDHLHKMAAIYHPELAKSMSDFRSGGTIPGRAKVAGDSLKNDTVPIMASPGEEVLPRSVTQAPDAPRRAAEFVRHLQSEDDRQSGYRKVAESRKSGSSKELPLKKRVERLEKLFGGGIV